MPWCPLSEGIGGSAEREKGGERGRDGEKERERCQVTQPPSGWNGGRERESKKERTKERERKRERLSL